VADVSSAKTVAASLREVWVTPSQHVCGASPKGRRYSCGRGGDRALLLIFNNQLSTPNIERIATCVVTPLC